MIFLSFSLSKKSSDLPDIDNPELAAVNPIFFFSATYMDNGLSPSENLSDKASSGIELTQKTNPSKNL